MEPPQTITLFKIGCYFLLLSFLAALAVSIIFCVVSIAVLGESIFACSLLSFLLVHDEHDEKETIIAAASTPIFNEVFIISSLKFCFDTANFIKVTRQKNIKKGSPNTGYLLRSNRINSSNITAFWSYPF